MSLRRPLAGIRTKLLMRPGVEKHLGDFGVDPKSASYTQLHQPSGGTKMKFVLAAAESTLFESCVPKFAGFPSW